MIGEVIIPPGKKLEDLIRLSELCVDLLRQNEEFYAEVRKCHPFMNISANEVSVAGEIHAFLTVTVSEPTKRWESTYKYLQYTNTYIYIYLVFRCWLQTHCTCANHVGRCNIFIFPFVWAAVLFVSLSCIIILVDSLILHFCWWLKMTVANSTNSWTNPNLRESKHGNSFYVHRN